ncbi:transposase [Shigella sonnei]|nr:transposase [Shigella sonnei]
MTESSDYESVQVFIGVDVGKDTHHAVAINRSGKRLFDKALPNDENKLRSLISDLKQHGQILLVVDQPATIGALPVAVARSEGVLVGYLPGLAMRRIADLHAGEAKTDARDAAIIAEAARTLPHALRTLKLADEQIAELSMLCGFDDDLAAQTTQASNRIRGLLTQIHPALERVLGPRLEHPAVLDLLQRYPSPEKLASLGPSEASFSGEGYRWRRSSTAGCSSLGPRTRSSAGCIWVRRPRIRLLACVVCAARSSSKPQSMESSAICSSASFSVRSA